MNAPSPPNVPRLPRNERLGTWLRDKYRLDAVLGVGGMAVVFAVTHRNGRRFALKLLHPELSAGEEFRKRFLREAYIANTVRHDGAVAVLDDDVAEDGSAFLVMDLLDGEGLDDVLDRYAMGIQPTAALAIAHQLLDVLAAAHDKNVVHRDIKPGNLFITRNGKVKVLDFGIARLEASDGNSTTRAEETIGTPAFMSPEQARGNPTDPRGDLYSAGATLFTLMTGRFVHEAETVHEMTVKAATEPARRLAAVSPHIPAEICECVDRALAYAPADRWQTAEAMRAAVAEAYQALTGGRDFTQSGLAELVARPRVAEAYERLAEPGQAMLRELDDPISLALAPTTLTTVPSLRSGSLAPAPASPPVRAAAEESSGPIAGEAVSTTQRSATLPPLRAGRRRGGLLLAAGAATALAVAAGVYFGVRASGNRHASDRSSPPTSSAAAGPETAPALAPLPSFSTAAPPETLDAHDAPGPIAGPIDGGAPPPPPPLN